MNRLNRRSFLSLAGAVGAAPPLAAALDLVSLSAPRTAEPSSGHLHVPCRSRATQTAPAGVRLARP